MRERGGVGGGVVQFEQHRTVCGHELVGGEAGVPLQVDDEGAATTAVKVHVDPFGSLLTAARRNATR